MADVATETSNTTTLTEQLADLKKGWLSSEFVPSDLSDWGVPGISKEKVGYVFDECSQLILKLSDINWQAPVALALRQSEVYLQPINNFIVTRLIQPNPEQEINNFLSNLQNLLVTLRTAAQFSSNGLYNAEQELLKLTGQIQAAKPILQDLNEINKELTGLKGHADTSGNSISNAEKTALDALGKITAIASAVSTIETQIKDVQTNVGQHLQQISTTRDEIQQLNDQYKILHEKVAVENIKSDEVAKTLKKQQDEIQKTIEDASRLGMAGSFRMRKKELVWPMILWGGTFVIGIASSFLLAYHKIFPLLEPAQFDWLKLLARLPLFGPFVWLCWFSVKQYGYSYRLWEDYSYKYASAMAFEGYKREASSVNPEMLRLLMEVSIINFANNPLRIFDTKTNHASPLNEMTDESKGFLQRLLEAYRATKSSKKP